MALARVHQAAEKTDLWSGKLVCVPTVTHFIDTLQVIADPGVRASASLFKCQNHLTAKDLILKKYKFTLMNTLLNTVKNKNQTKKQVKYYRTQALTPDKHNLKFLLVENWEISDNY